MELLLIPVAIAFVVLTGLGLRHLDARKKKKAEQVRREFLERLEQAEQETGDLSGSSDKRITGCRKAAMRCLSRARSLHDFDLTKCSMHTRAGEIAIAWAKALKADANIDWQDGRLTNSLLESINLATMGRVDLARSVVAELAVDNEAPFPVLQAAHDVYVLCLFREGKYDESDELAESGPTIYVRIDD